MTPALLLDFAVVALSWTAMASRLPGLRATDYAATRWLWLNLLLLSLAITVRLPVLYPVVGHVTGVPNLGWLVKAALVLTAAWAMVACLVHLCQPSTAGRVVRNRGLLLGAAIAVMAVLFGVSPQPRDTSAFVLGHHTPLLAVCVLVYLIALGSALVKIVRASWAFARLADRGSLRSGLRLTAVGGALSLAVLAHPALTLAAHRFHHPDVLAHLGAWLRLLCASGIALFVLGVTIPAWSVSAATWLRSYRDHRRLSPLWHTLTGAARRRQRWLAASVGDVFTFGHLHYRVYRRIRQTRNAMLDLQPWDDLQRAATARQHGDSLGLRGLELDAFTDATLLTQTLSGRLEPSSGQPTLPAARPGGHDQRSEAVYLAMVAAFALSVHKRRRDVGGARACLL